MHTKFDKRAAVMTVAVKKTIEARLNPVAKRLKQKRGHDGDDAARHTNGCAVNNAPIDATSAICAGARGRWHVPRRA